MKGFGGITLLMLLLLVLLSYRSRDALSTGPPAFLPEKPSGIYLYLGQGFPAPGVHQFSDGVTLGGVMELTLPGAGGEICQENAPELPLLSGELLEYNAKEANFGCFRKRWMRAGMRIALGIPLHPDQMDLEDWEILPGIGPRLAERIEMDRQINGDFRSYAALERVRGIGPQRIRQWEEFFLME